MLSQFTQRNGGMLEVFSGFSEKPQKTLFFSPLRSAAEGEE